MFTRIVELTSKPGKNKQLADTIDEKVLPILKKQKGFVDETVSSQTKRIIACCSGLLEHQGGCGRVSPRRVPESA